MEPSDCHILVVDDERISQIMVSSLLRKCNYKGKPFMPPRHVVFNGSRHCLCPLLPVTVAQGGSEAMEVLQRAAPGSFSLVLTVRNGAMYEAVDVVVVLGPMGHPG